MPSGLSVVTELCNRVLKALSGVLCTSLELNVLYELDGSQMSQQLDLVSWDVPRHIKVCRAFIGVDV